MRKTFYKNSRQYSRRGNISYLRVFLHFFMGCLYVGIAGVLLSGELGYWGDKWPYSGFLPTPLQYVFMFICAVYGVFRCYRSYVFFKMMR